MHLGIWSLSLVLTSSPSNLGVFPNFPESQFLHLQNTRNKILAVLWAAVRMQQDYVHKSRLHTVTHLIKDHFVCVCAHMHVWVCYSPRNSKDFLHKRTCCTKPHPPLPALFLWRLYPSLFPQQIWCTLPHPQHPGGYRLTSNLNPQPYWQGTSSCMWSGLQLGM